MKIQLTIIGLGQIGASIGLALSDQSELIYRVGYDEDGHVMRQAAKIGAVDKTVSLLKTVIENSDAVLLALPTDKMREMMEELVPLMKEGAVLLDTALSKETVANWAKELLPKGCFYVGLTPVINHTLLYITNDSGLTIDIQYDRPHYGFVCLVHIYKGDCHSTITVINKT